MQERERVMSISLNKILNDERITATKPEPIDWSKFTYTSVPEKPEPKKEKGKVLA